MNFRTALVIAGALCTQAAAAQSGDRVFLGESSVPSAIKRTDEFRCGDSVLKIDRSSTTREGPSIFVMYDNISTDPAPLQTALGSANLWDANFQVLDCPREEAARFYVEVIYGAGAKTLRFSVHAKSGLTLDKKGGSGFEEGRKPTLR